MTTTDITDLKQKHLQECAEHNVLKQKHLQERAVLHADIARLYKEQVELLAIHKGFRDEYVRLHGRPLSPLPR